ncbi:MAG: hypothetical protein CM1200mP13_02980 [Candidatus Pelagibacterales bacterium]|nr:MAG: hypothetical protein CM1200mP13_02980 [Pelagibacterales bacterium]
MYETDLANNFGLYYKKYKKKLSKPMQDAIVKGNKHSAKEYAEALDFMKRSYGLMKKYLKIIMEFYHLPVLVLPKKGFKKNWFCKI